MTYAQNSDNDTPRITPDLLKLKLRLSPLIQVEEALIAKLNPEGSKELEPTQLASISKSVGPKKGLKEVAINSASQWKDVFNRMVTGRESCDSSQAIDWDDPQDPGVILHACSEDMTKLWQDPIIQKLLAKQNMRLAELAGL